MTPPRVASSATYPGDSQWQFVAWAPRARRFEVVLLSPWREVAALSRNDAVEKMPPIGN